MRCAPQLPSHSAPTVLITGASQGLGSNLAESFWRNGYSLILVSRDQVPLEKLSQDLSTSLIVDKNRAHCPQKISVYSCDFAFPTEIDTLIKKLFVNHSKIDVLINNAAMLGPIGKSCDIWSVNPKSYTETIQVNLLAPIELSSRLIPLMSQSINSSNVRLSSIINLSGGGASGPRANFSAYATAKAGLVRFTETLAEEVKELGIRVNCIAPGAMNTRMMQQVIETGAKWAGKSEFANAENVIVEGGASMEQVAELALFLGSSDSNSVNGKLISAVWDNWAALPDYLAKQPNSDLFTLRRIAGRDRDLPWADL